LAQAFLANKNTDFICVDIMEDRGHYQLSSLLPNSPLRILQLTDLHHFPAGCTEFDVTKKKGRVVPIDGSPGSYSIDGDVKNIAVILARTQPQLVILTGDVIDGRPHGQSANPDPLGWRQCILDVLAPITAAGCAWTYVPGNHDDDGGPWARSDLLGIYQLGREAPGCISEGALSFDHTVTIGPSPSFNKASSMRLWLFDSGGNHDDPAIKYHTFNHAAVEGYRELSTSQEAALIELAYFHIPLPQASGLKPLVGKSCLFEAALRSGKVPSPWCWPGFTSAVRLLGKDRIVSSSKLESGLFDAFHDVSRVKACFFGHDHQNDAVFKCQDVYLIYGRVGGTTPPVDWEGDAGALPFEIGARMVEWDPANTDTSPAGKLSTWIELVNVKEVDSELQLDV